MMSQPNLINESAAVKIIRDQNLLPQFNATALHKVSRLLFEHRVLVGNVDQLVIAEALSICDIRQIRVSFLAVFSNNKRFVDLK